MADREYVYFKFGINVFRYPDKEFSKNKTDINLIENLVWKSKEKYIFEKNELSYELGETINIRSLETSKNLYEYIELPEQLSEEELIKRAVEQALKKQREAVKDYLSTSILASGPERASEILVHAYSANRGSTRPYGHACAAKDRVSARKKAKIKLAEVPIK